MPLASRHQEAAAGHPMTAHGLNPADVDVRKITPADSVYSYLMFTMPVEEAFHPGKITGKCLVAYILVIVTLLVKGILLFSVFKAVVLADLEWQRTVMGPGSTFLSGSVGKCNDGQSLCKQTNGSFSCAPPSVQLTGRWDELDTNGDGVWSNEEAYASREELMCKYVVDPVEVFDVFKKFILKREKFIWIHPDLRDGKSIHRVYFTYASGDLIMCGYRNEKMCPNLLQRGVFDAALREGTAPRVGKTIDSALDYCFDLLQEHGICERTLPSTYATWKVSSDAKCWGNVYDKYVYTHPTDGHSKSMLLVDYMARRKYSMASNSWLFRVFKGIIIGMFLLPMYSELKDVFIVINWVQSYPSAKSFEDGAEVVKVDLGEEGATYKIQGISDRHRYTMALIMALRLLMACILIVVGYVFLIGATSWVKLVLDGVAMIFIVEVANRVFVGVLDLRTQNEFRIMQPMYVRMGGLKFLNHHQALKDIVGFSALLLILVVATYVHRYCVGKPLSQAVECACLSSGDACREAHSFDSTFWERYWTQDVPSAFQAIDQLRAGNLATGYLPTASRSGSRTSLSVRQEGVVKKSGAGSVVDGANWHVMASVAMRQRHQKTVKGHALNEVGSSRQMAPNPSS